MVQLGISFFWRRRSIEKCPMQAAVVLLPTGHGQ
jgi:hypothetical protein